MFRKRKMWLFAFLILSLASCSHADQQAATSEQAPAEAKAPVSEPSSSGDLVYLQVKTVLPSSFDDTPDWAPPQNPLAVVDADLSTRWASKLGVDNPSVTFDFGTRKTVSLIKILWERAYAVQFTIASSDDGTNWQDVKELTAQTGGASEIALDKPVTCRFLKITGTKRVNIEWGISIWEVELYGPRSLNPEDKPFEEVFPGKKTFTEQLKVPAAEEIEKPLPGVGPVAPGEFQKGVVYTSWGLNELREPVSDKTLEYLYSKGVRAIAVMVPWFQDTIESTNIWPDKNHDTPTDAALAHVINAAHKLGIKVILKPHVDTKDGAWRGDIIASDGWFASYESFVLQYAKMAADYNVEIYCIGTELANTTIGAFAPKWEQIINKVKEIYKGQLTYGANWTEYSYVAFWDKMDFIGIDAYFPLTNKPDPTLEELEAAWKIHADKIEKWLDKSGYKNTKPVIFTEIGYSSAAGTNAEPWKTFAGPDVTVDEPEQANCLEAMLKVLSERSWFQGMYWWQYFPQERYNPSGYIIRGKLAEKTLNDWFSSDKLGTKEMAK